MEGKTQQVSLNDNTFKNWVTLYTKELYSWSLNRVNHAETAEDLVQETFLAAYKSLPSFKEDSSPRTWLFSILNRKIIDHYRTQAKSILESSKDAAYSIERLGSHFFVDNGNLRSFETAIWNQNDENELDNPAFIQEFKKCLNKLPHNWQTSVKAKYILEKNSKEVCKDLGITPTNYWQILHRAKLQLKQCLELNWFKR